MLTRKGMAEAMYAMDILAAKLGGGDRIADWYKETGLVGPSESARPTDAQIALYEGVAHREETRRRRGVQ